MALIDRIGFPKGLKGLAVVDGVPDGYEAFALATAAAELAPEGPIVFVARDGQRLPAIEDALAFAAPELPVIELPAWDCLPYDRVSPGADTAARRLDAMAAIASLGKKPHRAVVLTTANALLQRMPTAAVIEAQTFHARPGNQIDMKVLIGRLENSGFERVPTVRDVGEFAVRGGILDLYAPGSDEALRLDFFGDTLETIRAFDPATQRTTGQRTTLTLQAMSEVALTPETISRFRRNYIEAFGAPSRDDALYAAVSEGRRFAGMEHWLPFYYEQLDTLFDYLSDAPFVFDHLAREALAERHTLILDHYEARKKQGEMAGMREAVPYKPVPPARLYVSPDEVGQRMPDHTAIELTPFDAPFAEGRRIFHAGAKAGRSFEQERADQSANVFDAVVKHIADIRADGRKVIIAGWTAGSLDRLAQILAEHHLERLARGRHAGRCREAEAGAGGPRRAADRGGLRCRPFHRRRRAGHSGRPPGAPLQEAQAFLRLHRRAGVAGGRRHRRAQRSRHRPLHRAEDHRGGGRAA